LITSDIWGANGVYDGVVTLNGLPVSYSQYAAFGAHHGWADVTSIVKATIDAAAAGLVSIPYIENNYLDGSILAVIFDDPSQTAINTVVLLFGAQNTDGDNFNVLLSKPVDKTDPNLSMELSLGISYSYQPTGQYSVVDVNSQRLTTCAGGQDDGFADNGGLITVGGIGDSPANPPDPYQDGYAGPRYDDELYDLLPFVNNGDTTVIIQTLNPSDDDDLHFAALFMKSITSIVGEGILLTPDTATNDVGTTHTVTATVQDDAGNPIEGRDVTFNIISGPHAGYTATVATDANGQASYTYTGTAEGTDTITASFVDSKGDTKVSNEVTKEWVAVPETGGGARVWQLDSEIFGASAPTSPDGPQSQSINAVSIYEMEKNNGLGDDGQTGSVNIPAGETRTWVSDLVALADVTYVADGSWKVELSTDSPWIDDDASGCDVLIGQWDGSVFTPFSSVFNMFSVTWDTEVGKYIFELQGQSGDETVFKDNYLAIQITNKDDVDHTVYTGEGDYASCLTSPENDPGYPLPEMATGILAGLGLTGLAAFIIVKSRKSKIVLS